MRIVFLLCLLAIGPAAFAQTVVGTARISDGDTLRLSGEKIRLFGIDAPEAKQSCQRANGKEFACGAWASRVLRELVKGQVITCAGTGRDRYNRLIARCFVGRQDIAALMVERGAAVAFRKYSLDYVDQEKRASINGQGIWSMKFRTPGDWRAQSHGPARVNANCPIKGNITSNGRIYHLPGQRFYDKTRINTGTGERWFCTEQEARSAGWRRARR